MGIVAGCLIKQNDSYLLVQEKQPKVYGLWNFPAGYVDKGETIEAAAVREAKEETGYTVQLVRQVGVYHETVDEPVKHLFAAKIIGGERKVPTDEILTVAWHTFTEISALHAAGKLRAEWIWEGIAKDHSTKAYKSH